MTVTIRERRKNDAAGCGRICYEAFAAIACLGPITVNPKTQS